MAESTIKTVYSEHNRYQHLFIYVCRCDVLACKVSFRSSVRCIRCIRFVGLHGHCIICWPSNGFCKTGSIRECHLVLESASLRYEVRVIPDGMASVPSTARMLQVAMTDKHRKWSDSYFIHLEQSRQLLLFIYGVVNVVVRPGAHQQRECLFAGSYHEITWILALTHCEVIVSALIRTHPSADEIATTRARHDQLLRISVIQIQSASQQTKVDIQNSPLFGKPKLLGSRLHEVDQHLLGRGLPRDALVRVCLVDGLYCGVEGRIP